MTRSLVRDAVDAVFLALLVAGVGATWAIARVGARVDRGLFGIDGWLTR